MNQKIDTVNDNLDNYFLRLLYNGEYNVYTKEGVFVATFMYLDDIIDFLRCKGESSTYIENVLTREHQKRKY